MLNRRNSSSGMMTEGTACGGNFFLGPARTPSRNDLNLLGIPVMVSSSVPSGDAVSYSASVADSLH